MRNFRIMRRAMRMAVAALAAGAMAVAMGACGAQQSEQSGQSNANGAGVSARVHIVASINQWGSVARQLGGNFADVTSIMTNTNVEAHEYEPTTGDIAAFGKANIAIVNGADYDPWASKAAQATSATLIDAAHVGGMKEGANPHVWFSAKVRSATADAITAALVKADGAHTKEYQQLNASWHQREAGVEQIIEQARARTKGMPYAATESVAWYLADDLGMVDATPQGYAQASANDSEPTPSDISTFQNVLTQGKVKLLVVNTQEANATTDQLVQAAQTGKVKQVKLTEQMPQEYSTLIDWMTALAKQFAEASQA